MIRFSLEKNTICIKFIDIASIQFSQAVAVAKQLRCKWDSKRYIWTASASRFDAIRDAFSEVDILDQTFSQEDLEEATMVAPELSAEKVRRIPDYSLLKYPPIVGKHPNENFQKEAISKGINRSRYAYFYDMGTGKSYIASAIIAHRLYKYRDVRKVFFITSSIGVRNLKDELVKFIRDLDINRVTIADKNNRLPFTDDIDIVITNYNTLQLLDEAYTGAYKKINSLVSHLEEAKREKTQSSIKEEIARMCKAFQIDISADIDTGLFLKTIKSCLRKSGKLIKTTNLDKSIKEWIGDGEGLLLLDESHQLANPLSNRSKIAVKFSERFKYRYLFTGTPADVPVKLYNQFKILDPWLVYNMNFSEWKEKMAYLGTPFSSSAIRGWKKEELEKSNDRFLKLHGNYLSASDVLDLPDFFEKRIPIEMTPSHRYIYEESVSSILASAKDKQDMTNAFPYQLLSVDNPSLLVRHLYRFPENLQHAITEFKLDDLEKMKVLDDILADHPDEKILVWAIHPDTIKYIYERYKKLNPLYVIGDTAQEERNSIVNAFKKDPKHRMLIANITTLSTSVTLSPECHIQVYMERGFQFDQYSQSQRRIFRIGSEQPAITYIPIYKRSLDYLVDKNLSSKGLLVKGLVSKEFISQEEWKKIYNMNEDTTLNIGGV